MSATCRPGRRAGAERPADPPRAVQQPDIANASTWAQYSNGWRTGGDIECYCGSDSSGNPQPLTNWGNVQGRFAQVAQWQPYGGPGAFNDYDSIEFGDGSPSTA